MFVLESEISVKGTLFEHAHDCRKVNRASRPTRLHHSRSCLPQVNVPRVRREHVNFRLAMAVPDEVRIVEREFDCRVRVDEGKSVRWGFEDRTDVRLEKESQAAWAGDAGQFIQVLRRNSQ